MDDRVLELVRHFADEQNRLPRFAMGHKSRRCRCSFQTVQLLVLRCDSADAAVSYQRAQVDSAITDGNETVPLRPASRMDAIVFHSAGNQNRTCGALERLGL